jgi:hypothetical protein
MAIKHADFTVVLVDGGCGLVQLLTLPRNFLGQPAIEKHGQANMGYQ